MRLDTAQRSAAAASSGAPVAPGVLNDLIVRVEDLARQPRFRPLQRSFDVYYRDADRHVAMDRLYRRYITDRSLAFDIGSHVGDRIASFRRLGARVVACEPQPGCVGALDALYGDDPGVTLVGAACGAHSGKLAMHINTANPTVSTLAPDLVAASREADGWRDQNWDDELTVPVTTLDTLIDAHGVPEFIKIDVEGFEAETLAGLTTPVRALSFEFTTIQRDVALACLDLLSALGPYRFNIALGEAQTMMRDEALDARDMAAVINALPHAANSGDIYAELTPA